ncbi:hypothetical protein [Sphingopyxis sp. PET50]|uniref:hypothetical protein n=1 Tax=Sphingopyxis sp. PET50 TaxID=2976533 RepID=UPI0021AE7694|nr:hypothetical protein [Sphingopyxis sp. PET50]
MSFINIEERDLLVRRLREVPITQVRRECAERGKPRSYLTLARLAKADDDAREVGAISIGDASK